MNNQAIGFSISIMIHSLFGLLFLAGGTSLIGTPSPLALDFTLITSTPATTKIPQTKPIHKIKTARFKEKPPSPHKAIIKQEQDLAAVVIPEETAQPVESEEIIVMQEKPIEPEIAAPTPLVVAETAQLENSLADQETAGIESAALPTTISSQSLGTIYYQKHFNYIKDGIQQQVIYPRQAKMMGWEGRVVLSFTICADGRVEGISIVESSGFAVLDKKAVETIRKAAPFPSPPVPAELTIPIVFDLV